MTSRRLTRILVAADGTEMTGALIEFAAELAARLDTELNGLFIEDELMLRLASLDEGRLYGLVGGDSRPLDPALVEALFRSQASHVARQFDAIAGRRHLRGETWTRRGQVARELIAAAAEGDLLVLGWAGRRVSRNAGPGRTARVVAAQAKQPVLLLRGPVTGPVMALFDGSPDTIHPLELAAALAAALATGESGLRVLLPADDPDQAGLLKKQAEQILGDHPWPVHYQRVSAISQDKLCHIAHLHGDGLLVLSRRKAGQYGEDCADQLARSGCSLLWIP